jgi:hypothetical protein
VGIEVAVEGGHCWGRVHGYVQLSILAVVQGEDCVGVPFHLRRDIPALCAVGLAVLAFLRLCNIL